MTVTEAQATITSTEFLKWKWYLDWRDLYEFNRQDFYLAQIAAEVVRPHLKRAQSKTLKASDFLIKFEPKKSEKMELERRSEQSKNFWKAVTGLDGNIENQRKKKVPKKGKE